MAPSYDRPGPGQGPPSPPHVPFAPHAAAAGGRSRASAASRAWSAARASAACVRETSLQRRFDATVYESTRAIFVSRSRRTSAHSVPRNERESMRPRERPPKSENVGRFADTVGRADGVRRQTTEDGRVPFSVFFSTLEARISVNLGPIRLLLGPLIISARVLEIWTQKSLASTRTKSC